MEDEFQIVRRIASQLGLSMDVSDDQVLTASTFLRIERAIKRLFGGDGSEPHVKRLTPENSGSYIIMEADPEGDYVEYEAYKLLHHAHVNIIAGIKEICDKGQERNEHLLDGKITDLQSMSEVFQVPLHLDETWWGIYSGKKQVFKPNFNFEVWEREARAAIHAINMHDKLVSRIQELESALNINHNKR
ncbi:hypothetical protein I6Y99_004377 [Vibrio parahaemolyticus]|nr:hypothetical protein [Vibrio parahaemolyticus]